MSTWSYLIIAQQGAINRVWTASEALRRGRRAGLDPEEIVTPDPISGP
jgi:hypothetical protein